MIGGDLMKEKETFFDHVVELGTSLLIGYTISRFTRLVVARGQSMLPTIKHNQPLVLDCRAYRRRDPQRHDLVAFKSYQKNQSKVFLKRVIALPNEHLLIEDGKVYINHQLLDEPYLNEPMKWQRKIDLIIPEGHLFVMGDNRNHSLDSRMTSLGCIQIKDDIIGVVKQFRK